MRIKKRPTIREMAKQAATTTLTAYKGKSIPIHVNGPIDPDASVVLVDSERVDMWVENTLPVATPFSIRHHGHNAHSGGRLSKGDQS